MYGVHNVNTV